MRLLATLLLLPAATTLAQGSRYESPLGPPPEPAGSATTGNEARELLRNFDVSQGNLPGDNRTAQPASETPAARPIAPRDTATPARAPVATPPNSYTNESPYGAAASAATSSRTPTGSSAPADTEHAKRLMEAALTPPANTQLSGSAVYLVDVVARVSSRSEQSECIGAYWDLCSGAADYYLSLRELSDLGNVVARYGQTATLQQSMKKLEKRRDTALAAARASQRRLASLMGRNQSSPLPLPGDMPHCSGYKTYHAQYFPTSDSPEAAELDKLLPLRHAELLEAAATVSQAEKFFNTFANRPMNDQGVELLMHLEGLALKRRAFVQIARDYNKRVARYTELARPGQLGANRLVSMLIKTNGNVASRTSEPTQPGLNTRSEFEPPRTFQPGGNPLRDTAPRLDEDVMTTSGESPNMVEKVAPGETSVLRRTEAE
ncbi:hypothetical protein [Aeoliella sp.]|uniref:hypothetical protein n=1 Tax=Aeoliella sp. TaxID=2795800 RepID=UPI003CCBEE74